MIQISAVPATTLPIPIDPQGESGTEPTISVDFAALLAAQPAAVARGPEAGIPEAFAQAPAVPHAMTGKPGGKILPLPALPALAVAGEVAAAPLAEPQADPDTAAQTGRDKQADDAALPQVLPTSVPMAAAFIPQATIAILPSPVTQAPNLPDAQQIAHAVRGTTTAQSSQSLLGTVVLQPSAAEPGSAALQPAVTVLPDGAPAPIAKASVELRLPLIAPAPNGTTQAGNVAPEPQAPSAPTGTVSGVLQAITEQPTTPAQLPVVRSRPVRAKGDEHARPLPTVQSGNPAPTGEDSALVAPVQAMIAQPIVAAPQDQSTPPPVATPPSPSNNRTETPADFSTLVDRLVAAREAAQSSLTPGIVHAAVAHAEFGQVSLRFEQQDGTLNVAMASPDPDFVRSALAAAPAGQQGADNGDGRGSSGRQDSGQSMAQPQAQAQAQAGGQGTPRNPASLLQAGSQHRQAEQPAPSTSNREGQPPRRRGIFA